MDEIINISYRKIPDEIRADKRMDMSAYVCFFEVNHKGYYVPVLLNPEFENLGNLQEYFHSIGMRHGERILKGD